MAAECPSPDEAARRAERRANGLLAAIKATAKIASSLDYEQVLSNILDGFRQLGPCEVVALCLIGTEEPRLRVVAAHGLASSGWARLETAIQRSIPLDLLSQRSPVILDNPSLELTQSLRGLDVTRPDERGQVLIVPLPHRDQLLGATVISGARPNILWPETLESLTCFADAAAAAIANVRTHQDVRVRLQARLRDVANLSRISQAIGASLQPSTVLQNIVAGTAEAFTSAGCTILLRDDERGDMLVAADAGMGLARVGRRLTMDGSASGWVIRHVEPLFLPSVRDSAFPPIRSWFDTEGIKSFIGVPLVVQGSAIGSLNVYSRIGQRFDASDVELLQGLAAQAAIAITHAKLYESLGREKANLEAIVESLHEGLLLVRPDGVVAYANKRFVDCHGLDPRSGTPATIAQVWDALAVGSATPPETVEMLKTLETDLSRTVEIVALLPKEQHFEVRGFPVLSPQGDLLGRGYLIQDVTHRAEIERLKASMLSIVSHELRSPLAAIKGFATSLLRPDVEWDEASKRDFLEQIDREADRLGGLVTSLLDMSRLEAGMIRLDREWCDLAELMCDILGRMAPVVADHQVDVEVGNTRVLGFVDRRYLERVVWNLVENAVHYSPRGSTVAVSLAMEGDDFLLRVRDHGIGIKPEERDKVFQRFYRGPKARPGGVGLGLAICQGIVEAHGGTISFDSEPRKGSVFTVRVPCHPTGAVD